MLCWETPATYKIHSNTQLVYHFLVSASPSVALDEVQMDNAV